MTTLPSTTWQMLARGPSAKPLPRGLDAAWDSAAGILNRLVPRRSRFLRQAHEICRLEKQYAELTDARLRERADELRLLYRLGRD